MNIHEAKTNLSKLIEIALLGEEVIISKSGKPIVKLTAYKNNKLGKRKLGNAKNLFKIDKSFFEPLPKDLLENFYQ